LQEGGFRVNEVAARIGYKNANHFSTAFKQNSALRPKTSKNNFDLLILYQLKKRCISCCHRFLMGSRCYKFFDASSITNTQSLPPGGGVNDLMLFPFTLFPAVDFPVRGSNHHTFLVEPLTLLMSILTGLFWGK